MSSQWASRPEGRRVHQIALWALEGAPTLGDFMRQVEKSTGYYPELRGVHLVLWSDVLGEPRRRLSYYGMRRWFWIWFITAWPADFATFAATKHVHALARAWKGMLGPKMTPDQSTRTMGYVHEAGLIDVAEAMCAAVLETTAETRVDEVFERFCERCRGLIAERRRQGLPAPVPGSTPVQHRNPAPRRLMVTV